MSPHPGEHTGARVAHARKTRRLTQHELSDLSHVSYSTLTKVEQGVIPASPSVIGALARALSIPVTDLTGQPYLDELRQDQLDGLIQPIRDALDIVDVGPDDGVRPRPAAEMPAEADRLCLLVRAGNIKKIAAELPSFMHEAVALVHQSPSAQAWSVLAAAYRLVNDVASKLGFVDLGMLALMHLERAAERAGDPLWDAYRQYGRATHYLRAGQYSTGQKLIKLGMASAEQADEGRARDALTGQLHLGAAVLSARDRQPGQAEGHLAEAKRYAELTGPAERIYWLSFGPRNVVVHAVAANVELEAYDEALRIARQNPLPESGWVVSRLAHHYADLARAQLCTGQMEAAFQSLQRARKIAPQQTRYHPAVRETFASLESAKRRMPESFINYGAWLGR